MLQNIFSQCVSQFLNKWLSVYSLPSALYLPQSFVGSGSTWVETDGGSLPVCTSGGIRLGLPLTPFSFNELLLVMGMWIFLGPSRLEREARLATSH